MSELNLLDSLVDAITRLDGDALVMHVGEKPYVVTTSSAMSAFRGPLAWGQVELSSRLLTSEGVLGMLAQVLPLEQRQALEEFGAIEYDVPAHETERDRFTIVAARGGEDVWLELRRKPKDVARPAEATDADVAREASQPVDAVAAEEQGVAPSEDVSRQAVVSEEASAAVEWAAVAEAADETTEPQVTLTHADVDGLLAAQATALLSQLAAGDAEPSAEEVAIGTGREATAAEESASEPQVPAVDEPPALLPAAEPLVFEPEPLEPVAHASEPLAEGLKPFAVEPAQIAPEPEQIAAAEPLVAATESFAGAVFALDTLIGTSRSQSAVQLEGATGAELPSPSSPDDERARLLELIAASEAAAAAAVPETGPETVVSTVQEEPLDSTPAPITSTPVPEPFIAAPAAEAPQPEAAAPGPVERGDDVSASVAEPEVTRSTPAVVVPLSRPSARPAPPVHASPGALAPVEQTLRAAAARGATTVYLVAQSRPMVRVEGEFSELEAAPVYSAADIQRLVMDLAPVVEADEAGQVEWISDVPEVGRVRCLTFSDHRGPGAIFRMLPPRMITAVQTGLPSQVEALCDQSDGLVIVAGGRASGKSTLLSAFVDLINRTRSDHVITIEPQIGFVHRSQRSFVSQRELREGGAAASVRAALREDPDVLMVDDLRTPEVAEALFEAAGSGRLVFASVTAASSNEAVERLLDLFPADARVQARAALAGVLRGVVVQALLRKARGGRVAAREVLVNTPAVAKLIHEGRTLQLPVALEAGRRHGMIALTDTLASLVRDGTVQAAEACRRAADRDALLALLKRDGVDTASFERLA